MKYIIPESLHGLRGEPQYHKSQHQHFVTPVSSPLYVVTVVTNPSRYYSRYKLYHAFEKMVADAGAILYTVEMAHRDRHFEVTSHTNPHHIQLRSPDILWHKENLINCGISKLPANWEYVAWVDADVHFVRPDWVVETIHQLQTYKIVQMWHQSVDLGPTFDMVQTNLSIVHTWRKNSRRLKPTNAKQDAPESDIFSCIKPKPPCYGDHGGGHHSGPGKGDLHPGYAWAARRSAISDLGMLGDVGILGAGDWHMACALLGQVEVSFQAQLHPGYTEYWLEWQKRCNQHIERRVGLVDGVILHYWHGKKRDRRYEDRWKILVDNQFNPKTDIKYDTQGILQLTDVGERGWRLRQDLIDYSNVRDEDSVDL